jgi:HD-GYP domain-containing protein (c-di-GMP phosphodiesterase class II)
MSDEAEKPAVDPALFVRDAALLLRLAQVHALDNQIFDAPVRTLIETMDKAASEVVLVTMADTTFVNGVLARLRGQLADAAVMLANALQRINVQELTFERGITAEELRAFLAEYQRAFRSPTPEEAARQIVGRVRLRSIQGNLSAAGAFSIDARQNVLRTFARLAVATEEALVQLKAGSAFRSTALRRAVQSLADATAGHEALLAGVTRFPTFRGELHYHLASVAALTLLMAMRLELPKAALAEVTLAALFHDVGKALQDPTRGGDDSLRVPLDSMLKLSEHLSTEAMVQAAVAVEAGMPMHRSKVWHPQALARLIAVPCRFDLLTSARPPRKPLAPDQALRLVQEQAGVRFDPLVVRLFVHTIGLFPVGTTVRLTTGQLAIVLEVPKDAVNFGRPVVKVIKDETGSVDYTLDLANDPNGASISTSVDAEEEGVNPPHFLLS